MQINRYGNEQAVCIDHMIVKVSWDNGSGGRIILMKNKGRQNSPNCHAHSPKLASPYKNNSM
jgi:hypothetical protein